MRRIIPERQERSSVVLVLVVGALAAGCAGPGGLERNANGSDSHAAAADSTTPDEVVTLRRPPATPDDVVCTRETLTGSHMPERVCMTRAQREARREQSQEWLRSGGRRGAVSAVPSAH